MSASIVSDLNVDKQATTFSRAQARVGGIRSGAARRFKVRDHHAQVRLLHSQGFSQSQIAARVGYCRSTISRLLRGKIRTCLTAAETAAQAVAYPLLREVSFVVKYSSATLPQRAATPSRKRRKPRWNWFKGSWGDYFREKFAREKLDRQRFEERQEALLEAGGIRCYCGYVMEGPPQACPMCGREDGLSWQKCPVCQGEGLKDAYCPICARTQ